jgi:uncharacterized protein YegP (UPF0339 family)
MATFVISTRKNDEFQFVLKADNGLNILSSEGYSSKAACLNGIESVKKNSQDADNFEQLISTNNKHYFNLKAANELIIGSSQLYESHDSMVNGLAAVIKNAHNAVTAEE